MSAFLKCLACVLLAVLVAGTSPAADWPQRLGPGQNGITAEKVDVANWGNQGPEVLWRADVGTGVSSIVVGEGKAFAFGNRDKKQDVVTAFDAESGKQLWEFAYDCPLDPRQFTGGTAATPTYDGGMVYTLSHTGQLHALSASDGRVLWQAHLVKDYAGRRPHFGYAQSPVVVGNLLVVGPGGEGTSLLALDKKTGKKVWASGDSLAAYGTPLLYEQDGKQVLAAFNDFGLVGADPATGQELFRHRWKTEYGINATTPIRDGDRLFISSGYGKGSGLIRVADGQAEELWAHNQFQNQMTNAVLVDGVLYGFNVDHISKEKYRWFQAVEFATGKVLWKTDDPNMGALIVADGQLVIQSTGGELIIAEPSPAGFRETARFQLLGGKNWVTPSLANGILYLRNNQGKVVAVKAS